MNFLAVSIDAWYWFYWVIAAFICLVLAFVFLCGGFKAIGGTALLGFILCLVVAIIMGILDNDASSKNRVAIKKTHQTMLVKLLKSAGFEAPTSINASSKPPLTADGNIKYAMVQDNLGVEPDRKVSYAVYIVTSDNRKCSLPQYVYLAQTTEGEYILITFDDNKLPQKPNPASIRRLRGIVNGCEAESEFERQKKELVPAG